MTAQELIEILQRLRPETEIVVSVEVPHSTIGPSPCAKVTRAYSGFDWDSGTLQLQTEGHLVKFNDDQIKVFRQMKRETEKARNDAWNKYGGRHLSYEEATELSKSSKMETKVHPLFQNSYKGE